MLNTLNNENEEYLRISILKDEDGFFMGRFHVVDKDPEDLEVTRRKNFTHCFDSVISLAKTLNKQVSSNCEPAIDQRTMEYAKQIERQESIHCDKALEMALFSNIKLV